jgi:ribosomal protein S13
MLFYLNHEDEETQKKGSVMVAVLLELPRFRSTNATKMDIFAKVNTHFPMRVSVLHTLVGAFGASVGHLFNLYLKLATKESRARSKMHVGTANGNAFVQYRLPSVSLNTLFCRIGTHTEWMYTLMTYGIPHHLIPLTKEENIKLKNHLASIEMRKATEEYAQHGMVETCDLPRNCDVLLGRGKPIQEYRGNIRLLALLDDHLSLYHGFSKNKEKTALSAEIVKMVQSASGRFLTKESGVWIEVSDNIAREKVSCSFRARLVLMSRGQGSRSNAIKVRGATDPKSAVETNKRVKL